MNTLLSVFISLVVMTILFYLLLKQQAKSSSAKSAPITSSSTSQSRPGGVNTELVQTKWQEIQAMQSNGASGLKNALIETDKLLDYVMIQKGFVGDTMGDRLKSGGAAFTNLNAIWSAHKLRNQLAHEVEHDVVAEQVKGAIKSLGNGMGDLGVSI